MARQPRIEFAGAWYHIMNRGAGRRRIFHDDADRSHFLELLSEIQSLWAIEIHSYSIMDNHYHLLICTPEAGISKAMRHLGAEYTQYYNRKYKTDGALFRGRFKSILTERDSYLSRLVRYIHLNPVKAGLCKDPVEHRWTSHRAYMQRRFRPSWLKVGEVLSDFGASENAALKKFQEYVLKSKLPDLDNFIVGQKRRRILGSEGFCDWVKGNILDAVSYEKKLPLIRCKARRDLSTQRILEYVAFEYGISKKTLQRRSGNRFNEAKSLAIYLCRNVNAMTHPQIAQAFDMKPQAVSKYLQRLKQNSKSNEILKAKAEAYRLNLLSYVQS